MNIELIRSEIKSNSFNQFIEKISREDNVLILYGVGSYGNVAMKFLKERKININFLCDSNRSKWNEYSGGIKIISPDELKEICGSGDKEVVILITSTYWKEIKEQLNKKGVKENIYSFSKAAYLPKGDREYSGLGVDCFGDDYIDTNIDMIQKLYSILEDEESRSVLTNIIKGRLTYNNIYFSNVMSEKQYFDEDIFKLNDDEVFVDGGAYNGDTIEKFISITEGKYKKIYAFEPNEFNYKILENKVKINDYKNTEVYNYGLYNKTSTMTFDNDENNPAGGFIKESGKDTIEVISLDELLKNKKITFLKMDIEGSELEALEGSKDLITINKPKLAICLYHKRDDLWKIPLFIKNLNLEYKFFIRHHSSLFMETVLYAI